MRQHKPHLIKSGMSGGPAHQGGDTDKDDEPGRRDDQGVQRQPQFSGTAGKDLVPGLAAGEEQDIEHVAGRVRSHI